MTSSSEEEYEWNLRVVEDKWNRFKFETTVLEFPSFKVGEAQMGSLPAVIRTRVGYDRIHYLPCCVKRHELVEVEFDPLKASYTEILFSYMRFIKGEPKRVKKVNIFVMDEYQSEDADDFKKRLKDTWDGKFIINVDYLFHKAHFSKQKLFLQKTSTLFNMLGVQEDDDELLLKSHIACRLNAYCYGLGSEDKFVKDLKASVEFPKQLVDEIMKILKNMEKLKDTAMSSSGSSGNLSK